MGCPSFLGKSNHTKAASFELLRQRSGGLFLSDFTEVLGVPRHSMSTLLARWTRWKYVLRRVTPLGFKYRLARKGVKWLVRWSAVIPWSDIEAEVQDRRGENSDKEAGQ